MAALVTEQMLRNLSDALDDLTNGGQVQLTSNSNNDIVPDGITHSLRIMCFVVHLSQLPNAFRQADQWKTLCDATTSLICKALGIQTSPTGTSIPILVTAMQPRFLITLDEELNPLPVTVRVGQVGILTPYTLFLRTDDCNHHT